jgi:hypothetical protein
MPVQVPTTSYGYKTLDFSGTTAQSIATGAAGKKVMIWALRLNVAGATTLTISSGATAGTALTIDKYYFAGAGAGIILDYRNPGATNADPYIQSLNAAETLYITSSASTVQVNGVIEYTNNYGPRPICHI